MVTELFDEYRGWFVLGIVIVVVIGMYVLLQPDNTIHSSEQHYLSFECDVREAFSIAIIGSDGASDFEGDINLPFTVLLKDDTYDIRAWYVDNGTTYGYETTIDFYNDMMLHVLL